jgi:pimeloyl-ACP methyl ester carboxylesterase
VKGATTSRIQTNGIELVVHEAGPKGNPVVLCHGFPELSYSWRHQIEPLAAAGFHVICPDQRGYGESSAPKEVEAYRIEELHDDLLGLLDHHGYENAHFVGHDWGSFVVWEMAMRHPSRVRSVTGVSVPFIKWAMKPTDLFKMASNNGENFFYILYFQEVGPAERELDADPHRSMRMILWGASGDRAKTITSIPEPRPMKGTGFLDMMEEPPSPLPAWLTEEDLKVYAAAYAHSGFFGPVSWYRNFDRNFESGKDLSADLVTMPSFFIGGDRDGVIANRAGVDAMKDVLPDFRGSVIIPEAGHWTQQETPDAFNEALLGFLKTV